MKWERIRQRVLQIEVPILKVNFESIIHLTEMAKSVKHFKEEEGGRKVMCEAVERYAERKVAVKVEEERSLITKIGQQG